MKKKKLRNQKIKQNKKLNQKKNKKKILKLTSKEEKLKAEEKKNVWKKHYDGTKYNNNLVQIQNANSYSNSPVLNQSFKSVDGIEYGIKHIEISTQIQGLDGQVHTAPKGYSFLVASCSVESTDMATEMAVQPYIEFEETEEDDGLIKDGHIAFEMAQEQWVNDSDQLEVIDGNMGSLPEGKTKNVNFIYQISNDNVRYMTMTDETGSLDFYNDLNNASFELGQLGEPDSSGSNINACLQEQQEQ